MELLEKIFIDFILFSLIEGVIYSLFFYKICKLKKMSINQILLMSIGNCLISSSGIFPPILYQIFMILFMGIILSGLNNIDLKLGIKYSVYAMLFQLVVEMIYSIVSEFIFGFDLTIINKIELFYLMIPLRIIQLIIIIYGGIQMKGWLGEIKKPIKK